MLADSFTFTVVHLFSPPFFHLLPSPPSSYFLSTTLPLHPMLVPLSPSPLPPCIQTLYLSEQVLVCDCPGLVFPSFVSSKAEMICSGILPIDQLRDHTPPVSLVCQRIPREMLERTYGITIPRPKEGENPNRDPYSNELLAAYGSK